jgi:hypothetical protein
LSFIGAEPDKRRGYLRRGYLGVETGEASFILENPPEKKSIDKKQLARTTQTMMRPHWALRREPRRAGAPDADGVIGPVKVLVSAEMSLMCIFSGHVSSR